MATNSNGLKLEKQMVSVILILCACVLAYTVGNVTSYMYDRVSMPVLLVWLGVVVVAYSLFVAFILRL